MRHVVLLVVVCCVVVCEGVKFGQLCSRNPTNRARTSDSWGQGHYGAPRGNRRHRGLDIVCRDGDTIYAPFDVTVVEQITIYNDPAKAAIDRGLRLRGQGLCFKLFYVRPFRTSGLVKKGKRLGTMLPMQRVYPGITSHVHVHMCDNSNPTRFF